MHRRDSEMDRARESEESDSTAIMIPESMESVGRIVAPGERVRQRYELQSHPPRRMALQ